MKIPIGKNEKYFICGKVIKNCTNCPISYHNTSTIYGDGSGICMKIFELDFYSTKTFLVDVPEYIYNCILENRLLGE